MTQNKFRYKVVRTFKGLLLIAKLKLLSDSITTESRNGRCPRASYRCNKALVVKIFDPFNKKQYRYARSLFDINFKYIKGQIVTSGYFDEDINIICTNGIHYFLYKSCAFGFMSEYRKRSIPKTKFLNRIKNNHWNGTMIILEDLNYYKKIYNNGICISSNIIT